MRLNTFGGLALCLGLFGSVNGFARENKPNVVVILVDDMGWTDLACFGSKFYQTPHIDRLAAQGMKFTQAYSACTVCSPTRAAILTGQYPARLHVTDWIAGHVRPYAKLSVPDWTKYLSPQEMNLAQALKAEGYVSASIGKWHLGEEEHFPDKQGFDVNVAGYNKGQPPSYFAPYKIPTLKEGPEGEFLSDRLTEEALHFIEENKERPFFLYLPHYAVHTPLQAKPEVISKYKNLTDPAAEQKNAVYAALVESVDDSVGRILDRLDSLHLSQNTVIIFTSDNGGLKPVTSNTPLRAGKGSSYEGGVRVPLIVKWPGVTKPGTVSEAPVITVDCYPTVIEMAGATKATAPHVDGASLVPLLRETAGLKREAIYWHYPHYHPGGATPYSAVREGDFKLIEFFEDKHVELYNLKDDIGETVDLASKLPEKAAQLRARLERWRMEVGAQLPTPNPAADPVKDAEKKGKAAAAKYTKVLHESWPVLLFPHSDCVGRGLGRAVRPVPSGGS
jgi:arylsulfatase A-like enzyme